MDDVVKAMHEAGFVPTVNTDEDFPPVEGEYGIKVKALKPWVNDDTDVKEAYLLQLTIANTLSGEIADGRVLSRFYRIAGNGFNGEAVTYQQAMDNVKRLLSDLFTLGVSLDATDTPALEASFGKTIDAPGYARAWKSKRRDGEGFNQNFRIKVAKDLRKASQETASSTGAKAPF